MTDKITTTLAQIRAHSPCEDGYKKLAKNLGGVRKYGKDTPVTFRHIFENNGYEDTLWCLRTLDEKHYPLWRHFAIDAAEMVEHLMTDDRSHNALRVARKHADGEATDEELDAAWAAWDAAWAAGAAARAAAGDAAWAAGAAARAAARDAGDAAWDSAGAAARAAQMKLLFEYCRTGKRVDWKKFLGGNPLKVTL